LICENEIDCEYFELYELDFGIDFESCFRFFVIVILWIVWKWTFSDYCMDYVKWTFCDIGIIV